MRKTSDLGQLQALLNRSKEYGNQPYKNNIDEVVYGIGCLINDVPIDRNRTFYSTSLNIYNLLKDKFLKFNLNSTRREYDLSTLYENELIIFENGGMSIHDLASKIKDDNNLDIKCKKYWMTKIAEVSYELEVMPFLFKVYEENDFDVCRTQIKKTFRAIDMVTFGPRVEIENDRQ